MLSQISSLEENLFSLALGFAPSACSAKLGLLSKASKLGLLKAKLATKGRVIAFARKEDCHPTWRSAVPMFQLEPDA
jgi:hypothetical protein